MIESSHVLSLMKVVYVIYITIVVSLIWRYAVSITKPGKESFELTPFHKKAFYGLVGVLVFAGVGIHILTFNKIPWVKWDLNRDSIKADKEYNITIADYKFHLPDNKLFIKEKETVRFNLESKDYTYGFGLFREDGSMAFQMQVVPGHKNDLVWKFDKSGNYTIRSTEYSGPKGGNLFAKNVVVVASETAITKLMSDNELVIKD